MVLRRVLKSDQHPNRVLFRTLFLKFRPNFDGLVAIDLMSNLRFDIEFYYECSIDENDPCHTKLSLTFEVLSFRSAFSRFELGTSDVRA